MEVRESCQKNKIFCNFVTLERRSKFQILHSSGSIEVDSKLANQQEVRQENSHTVLGSIS